MRICVFFDVRTLVCEMASRINRYAVICKINVFLSFCFKRGLCSCVICGIGPCAKCHVKCEVYWLKIFYANLTICQTLFQCIPGMRFISTCVCSETNPMTLLLLALPVDLQELIRYCRSVLGLCTVTHFGSWMS